MLKNDAPPLHINCDNCHTGHHRCATPHVLTYELTFVSDWVEEGIIVSVINMSLSVFKASPFQHATFLQSCFQRQIFERISGHAEYLSSSRAAVKSYLLAKIRHP